MIGEIGFVAAFVAGFLSFVAPCTLILVPIFVAYLAGITLNNEEDLGQARHRLPVFLNTVSFVLGFTLVFVLLGASLGAISDQVSGTGAWLARVGGTIIIIFGLISMGLLKIPLLMQERSLALIPGRNIKYVGSFVVGSTMGVGWIPCVGPILGSILVLAGTGGSVAQGSLLLLAYSLGMMMPFLAFGLFAGWGTRLIRQHGHLFRYSGYAAGAMLIVLGIVVFTDNLGEITGYFGFLAQA